MKKDRAILIILDGWGLETIPEASAIAQADTPYIDSLYQEYPHARLITHGEDVGLPEGQMGNSEVGHLNIGAGRVVYQELARINKAVREKTLHEHPELLSALQTAKAKGSAVHFIGLVSDGGVHSHINHLKALVDIADTHGPTDSFIHAFTDGRDVDPKSGKGFIEDLENYLHDKQTQLASVVGRYYAMDRDKRWERIKLAYDLLVDGKGTATTNVPASIQASYDEGVSDEFILPLVKVKADQTAVGTIKDGDLLICFNFRTDRPRQISEVLTQRDHPEQEMKKLDLTYLTMTRYDASFENITVLFQKENLEETIGEVIAGAGMSQVRIAETEKYPHVTFFLSGGREAEFANEKRLMVASPQVATYDLQPEMSAPEITNSIINEIRSNQPNFICLNYANTDMVGHTGVFSAAIQAAEVIDALVKQLINVCLEYDYQALIIADHGNSDFMINTDGSPNTAHTTNLVPLIFVSKESAGQSIQDGRLADVAPTLLALLGVDQPQAMTGRNLIQS